jgi:hypothetical protein
MQIFIKELLLMNVNTGKAMSTAQQSYVVEKDFDSLFDTCHSLLRGIEEKDKTCTCCVLFIEKKEKNAKLQPRLNEISKQHTHAQKHIAFASFC